MWRVEYQFKQPINGVLLWSPYSHRFKTEEEATAFMVKKIFEDPSYNHRVREK